MKLSSILVTGFVLTTLLCSSCSHSDRAYESDQLVIKKLTDHTYIHHSYLATESFGHVTCNGLIYLKDGQAVVFDTPTDDLASKELIRWIQDEQKSKVNAVVVTHFHEDCLGGLGIFHEMDVPSYSNELTRELAESAGYHVPMNGFVNQLIMPIAGDTIYNEFLGQGHTTDNIVSFISSEGVLFGGCLIKSVGAGQGNLEDSNIDAWSETVRTVKDRFGAIQKVVPGHGKPGTTDLLDYTIDLFDTKNETTGE